jgi:hypothetical protein
MKLGSPVLVRWGATFSLGLAATAALLGAGGSAPAQAATCPPPPATVLPFAPWGDANDYVLTTGGSFESGTAPWSLSGGSKVVADNAPNALDSASATRSLYLPAGSSATSACVTAPGIIGVVRFFAKSVGASGGQLKVEVLVKGAVYQAGTISAGSAWSPSPALASNAPVYKGAVTYQVRLTAVGSGAAFTVDDVYFDPYKSR